MNVGELTRLAGTPTMAEAIAKIDATRLKFGLTGITDDEIVAAVREVREVREELYARWD